jgi:hypothetical protein
MLTLVDEFTRECLAISVKRSQKGVDVQETLAQIIKERGQPCYLRSDNGSEFIEKSLQKCLKAKGVASILIEPGSPWQNCPQSLPAGLTNVDAFQGTNVNRLTANCGSRACMPTGSGPFGKPKSSLKCGARSTIPFAHTERLNYERQLNLHRNGMRCH